MRTVRIFLEGGLDFTSEIEVTLGEFAELVSKASRDGGMVTLNGARNSASFMASKVICMQEGK